MAGITKSFTAYGTAGNHIQLVEFPIENDTDNESAIMLWGGWVDAAAHIADDPPIGVYEIVATGTQRKGDIDGVLKRAKYSDANGKTQAELETFIQSYKIRFGADIVDFTA